MGLEGIVSKGKDSAYRSGRSPDWLKMKNSAAPAVKPEAEEEWGGGGDDHNEISFHIGSAAFRTQRFHSAPAQVNGFILL